MISKAFFRHLSSILCAAALCMLLTACGNKATTLSPATAETATVETATAETATVTPKKTATADAMAVSNATVLPKTADAGRSYVDNTLFIGDSNTARYMMYADETGTAFTSLNNNIGVVSMGAESIVSLKCEQFKGYKDMCTIPDSVAMLKPQRLIIGFGSNNLKGSSTDANTFIKNYLAGLQAIEKAWPHADIIVSAIPPLDKQRENTNLTMTQVDAYNEALVAMCKENNYNFLDTSEVLKDSSTGWAKKDYTLSDGVHLSKTAVTELFGYIRTHAYITEDRRPQPLGDIPTPAGSPVGLISSDPIAVRGAKVPVEFVSAGGGTLKGYTSQRVAKGGTCSGVTAVPNAGWKFSYWSASYGTPGGGATVYFTVPSSANANGVVLTAHFVADEHEHDYVEISGTRVDPTYEYAGSAQYKCTICGDVIEKEIPKLTATATPTAQPTATPTTTPTATPTATPTSTPAPTSTSTPTPPPHQHSYAETARTPSTCTVQGSVTYTCSSCGNSYTEALPLAPHNFANGVCTVCGAADPNYKVHQHAYVETARIPSTCTTPGSVTYTCSCGDSYTEALPLAPHSFANGVCTVCGAVDPNYVPPAPPPEPVVTEVPPPPPNPVIEPPAE